MLQERIQPLGLQRMERYEGFWKQYMELVRCHVIPYQWDALNDRLEEAEASHCIKNFEIAAGRKIGKHGGCPWQDTDLYKWLEAVAYTLIWHQDKNLEKLADQSIDLIAAAQQSDGYLDTYYILNGLEKRFTNLMADHELYCLGHLIEAAVAYYQATGKSKLLEVAERFIGCVERNIGREERKKPGYPGHEVAEMALVKLYRLTGNKQYLQLAEYFIEQRGQEPLYFEEELKENGNDFFWKDSSFRFQYYQAGLPVRKQQRAEGHAVRACYLYSGMADLAGETADEELFAVCEKIWNNIVRRQMYIHGGIGASAYGESFTFDYDLPNDTIYAETCAAISLAFFAERMFELTGESKYMDVLERALYNGIISGMSMDGKRFFYVNPLEVWPEASEKDNSKKHVRPERQKWFGCACCPPNVARLLSSLGEYAYGQRHDTLYINLYMGGSIKTDFGGQEQLFEIETNYPWEGKIRLTALNDQNTKGTVAMRIPEWCQEFTLRKNGVLAGSVQDGYVCLTDEFKSGDALELDLQMPVRLVQADTKVRENIGKVALMRGPLLYCLEEVDNGSQLHCVYMDEDWKPELLEGEDILEGMKVVRTEGKRLVQKSEEDNHLYQEYREPEFNDQSLLFIPYFAWNNRSKGEMMVWIKK